MIRVGSIRFFLTVSPPPVWMRIAIGCAALLGIVTLWLSPREVDSALGSVLLLQMFAVSNGYRAAASRGFFDPLLVTSRGMWRLAGGNLAAAALPGFVAWTAITVCAMMLGQAALAAAPQRHVAFVLVSTIAWSAGLAMPRMAGGVLWAVLIVGLAMSRLTFVESLVTMNHATVGWRQVMAVGGAGAVCPFLLLGSFPALDARVLGVDLLLALAIALLGVRDICRRDHPLVVPS